LLFMFVFRRKTAYEIFTWLDSRRVLFRSKVRSGALGAPQHRTVIFGFHRQRIGSIAFHLVTKGPDHLAVTGIAAFAHVDVPAGKIGRASRREGRWWWCAGGSRGRHVRDIT